MFKSFGLKELIIFEIYAFIIFTKKEFNFRGTQVKGNQGIQRSEASLTPFDPSLKGEIKRRDYKGTLVPLTLVPLTLVPLTLVPLPKNSIV